MLTYPSMPIQPTSTNGVRFSRSDDATTAVRVATRQVSDKVPGALREAMKAAFVVVFSNRFSEEIDKVVDAYRIMLRESLAKERRLRFANCP